MDEKSERTLEQLEQDFEEAKVARNFVYSAEGQKFIEILERTQNNFNSFRFYSHQFVNPLSEMCRDAEYQGLARGIGWVINMLKSSGEEVKRLQREIEDLGKREELKQVGLINKFESKIR